MHASISADSGSDVLNYAIAFSSDPPNPRKCRTFPRERRHSRKNRYAWLTRQSTANRSPRADSLLTGNLTGNFSNLGLFLRFLLLINEQIQMLASKFPSKWNRELFLPNREFSRRNRELDLGSIF